MTWHSQAVKEKDLADFLNDEGLQPVQFQLIQLNNGAILVVWREGS